MSIFHPSPILDSGGNSSFIPSASNNTDISLLSINWNTDIINKPSFCNISFTANYNDLSNLPDLSIYSTSNYLSSSSNSLFSSLSNIDLSTSNDIISFTNQQLNSLVSSQWTTTSSSNIYLSLSGNVGIGSSIPSQKLDVAGNINSSDYLINNLNISNIFLSSNVFDNQSNNLFTSLSNQDYLSSTIKITSSQWSNNTSDIYYNLGHIGIGTSSPSYPLEVLGNINSTHYLINNTNLSNIFTTSNITDYKSNICISYVDSRVANLISSQWETSGNDVFLNKSGNVGIGSSSPSQKLDISGNLIINGNIYPSITSNFDLGSSNLKWNDLYLSGNSIYIDDIIINKNNDTIEIKNSNLPLEYLGISINHLSLQSNNHLSHILLDNNGTIFINSNGINKYPVNLNNSFDYSNIIYSNALLIHSNNIISFNNNSINSINTDTIPIGTSNRFITNDVYNRNLTINGNLYTSNLITSNLNVIGDSTTLNTNVYQTEQLQIVNDTTATSLVVRQVNTNNNVAEFYYNNTNNGLTIDKSGNVGIGSAIPSSILDINGGVNINNGGSLIIGGVNINTNITSNTNYTSNNLYLNISNIDFLSSNANFIYSFNSSNNIYNLKQNNLTASTNLLGNGSAITNINYDNIATNKPDLSIYSTTSTLTTTSNNLYTSLSNQDYSGSNRIISFTNSQISGITTASSQWITSNSSYYYFNSNKNAIISSTTSNYVISSQSDISINSGTSTSINSGTYNIIFDAGLIYVNIGNATPIISDKSYPIVSPANLVAWYKFDDNANLGVDSSGNEFNTSVNGTGSPSITTTDFKKGISAIQFNGTSGFKRTIFSYLRNDIVSYAFWCKFPSDTTNDYRTVFSTRQTVGGSGGYVLYGRTTNALELWNPSGETRHVYANFCDNTWKHVVVIIKITANLAFVYINGININTSGYSFSPMLALPSTNNYFRIGAGENSLGNDTFYISNGSKIDDFRIYSKELTGSEVSQLYNGSLNIYNPFNEKVGIGTNVPNYTLDVAGELNTNQLLLNANNISNIFVTSNVFENNSNNIYSSISNLDFNTSNNSIAYTNSKLSTIGSVNQWTTNGNNIYYNQGNIGIGTTNPLYSLDILGDLNINGDLRISNVPLPFTTFSNTDITTSNASFNYINNLYTHAYYLFLTNGSITFPQTTSCDILMVGAGGNGGFGGGSGGGGAGEVIYYPSSNFTSGIYDIQVGYSSYTSTERISRLLSGTNELIKALGGGDGANYISPTLSIGGYTTTNISGTSDYYYSFTTVGTSSITLDKSYTCDILVVGGGGGGGTGMGGGGGAGGLVYITNYTLNSGSYTITVGNGGTGTGSSSATTALNNGQNSTISGPSSFQLTAIGGGFGVGQSLAYNGTSANTGGSGGGGARNGNTGGVSTQKTATTGLSSTYGYGNNGGNGTNTFYLGGGGGGGAGSAGVNATTTTGGNGGIGMQINITGVSTYYAGGGGAAFYKLYNNNNGTNGSSGIGGLGGGGNAKSNESDGSVNVNGVNGTGGGGGGMGDGTTFAPSIGGTGGSGIVIIRFKNLSVSASSGGSGGGSYLNNSAASAGTKWNATYSYSTSGYTGTASVGGNGGSALVAGGYTETITGTSLIVGVGGLGASSSSIPQLKTTYGSGGDGNGGLGTSGIVIIRVPLNQLSSRFDGYINYSNVFNRPLLNDLYNSSNYINILNNNQVNFPIGNVSWKNEWFLYIGTSPTSVINSFIFWHSTSTINSKWWFNGTTTATNAEISDMRIKKEITNINNPLNKLMSLNTYEYHLCDDKDYLKKYGILAQEVESNQDLNHLIYTDDDYIANIYLPATFMIINEENENRYFLKTNEEFDINEIEINNQLKILLNNIGIDNQEIIIEETPYHNRYKKRFVKVKEIIDNKTIEIYENIELSVYEVNNLFIYGKRVNDFKKLDYSSLYSLNIRASQEMMKIIEEQTNELNELNNRLNLLYYLK